jgi:hypothetical protein
MSNRWETNPIMIEPYHYKVNVIVGEKELEKFTNKAQVGKIATDGWEGAAIPLAEAASGATFSALYLKDVRHSIIVHECVHIVHDMLKDRGVPTGAKNTEVVAYHVEHLYSEVVKELKARRIPIKA